MSKLKELNGRLQERRDLVARVLEEIGPERDMSKAKSLEGETAQAKLEKFRAANDEMTDLAEQIKKEKEENGDPEEFAAAESRIKNLGAVQPFPVPGLSRDEHDRTGGQKSMGELFIESESYKQMDPSRANQFASAEAPYLALKYAPMSAESLEAFGLKTTFTVSAATLTSYDRQPAMVLLGQQRLTVADLLAKGQTNAPTIRYVKEDTFTNAATTVAEGGTKPEAAWDTSEVDAPVKKIAVLSRVTDELFADFPAIRDYIDNRMRFMLGTTEEAQLLNGDGTGSNLTGILQTSGIQTQAKGTDPTPDTIFKAITKVRFTGFFEPDGYVTHPTDWQGIRLLRDANGNYIWGHPSVAGPDMIWGLRTVVTTAITQGTGLVGAFQLGAQVFYRQGVTVDATNSNEDDFKKNLVMLRAEQREALAVYRPKAFCSCTGL